jgi:hypothetical protein
MDGTNTTDASSKNVSSAPIQINFSDLKLYSSISYVESKINDFAFKVFS